MRLSGFLALSAMVTGISSAPMSVKTDTDLANASARGNGITARHAPGVECTGASHHQPLLADVIINDAIIPFCQENNGKTLKFPYFDFNIYKGLSCDSVLGCGEVTVWVQHGGPGVPVNDVVVLTEEHCTSMLSAPVNQCKDSVELTIGGANYETDMVWLVNAKRESDPINRVRDLPTAIGEARLPSADSRPDQPSPDRDFPKTPNTGTGTGSEPKLHASSLGHAAVDAAASDQPERRLTSISNRDLVPVTMGQIDCGFSEKGQPQLPAEDRKSYEWALNRFCSDHDGDIMGLEKGQNIEVGLEEFWDLGHSFVNFQVYPTGAEWTFQGGECVSFFHTIMDGCSPRWGGAWTLNGNIWVVQVNAPCRYKHPFGCIFAYDGQLWDPYAPQDSKSGRSVGGRSIDG